MPESPEITAVSSGRLSDRHAFVKPVLRDNGDAVLQLRFVGNRGGGRTEWVRLNDAGRRRLIRNLGGVPADADPAAAPYVEIDRAPVGTGSTDA